MLTGHFFGMPPKPETMRLRLGVFTLDFLRGLCTKGSMIRTCISLMLLATAAFNHHAAVAQDQPAPEPPRAIQDSDRQGWTAISVAGPVEKDSKLLLWFDGHARFRDDASDLGVTIFRPGLGWRVADGLDLWMGYADVIARPELGDDIEEQRFWQQATYRITEIAGGQVGGRTRLEQRFRGGDSETGWRFRQQIRWAKPIGNGDVSLIVWDELFFNLNDATGVHQGGFDQNRLFVGGAFRLSDSARIEAGYLNNILNPPGPDNQVNHNVSIGLFFAL
ncbi:DUF2490 domain-containing protein [Alterisphingorhabdus coralli]|uniref:DUF2490 domain-containing protein n=1 Tax=Alterisphingorhabdus coralli TaxID=3071408 RepID=A0AA97I153_9SPHN|nr:DUF2490 domain-containing protein [Parasphingorhabdus sp. SCSIO 66989]WOE74405.1 DUF2490 domain-containing protein [Parasphingorhabdus sp. SCSIO 66989]